MLKILFVTTEEAPFAKVGGLGEVMFALPRALALLGHDARVMIPFYGAIEREEREFPYVHENLEVPTAPNGEGKKLMCNVRRYDAGGDPRDPVTTYFLENQEYYELRANVYGYTDDRLRFALLSRGCLEFLKTSGEWMPDIIVTTDWMTGYLPNMLKTEYAECAELVGIATVFSIHNLASQGTIRDHNFLQETERDDGHGSIPDFFDERMPFINAMRRGISYADIINTVSQAYTKEITTEEFGEGLELLLREKRGRLFGVLNGIDYETNNPATDPYLERHFTERTIVLREENKIALQRRFNLPEDKNVFMMGVVSRLVRQKGFDLLTGVMEDFLKSTKAQLVVVGTGDPEIMDRFQELEKEFPGQARVHLQFDGDLPHLIFGGCDVIVVPSKFEPSGLTQMEAMRFGAVPVARRVGGLADTIKDCDPENMQGTGFLFDAFEPNALLIAMTRAFVNWGNRDAWRKLQRRVMREDFSWDRSAKEYVKLFERALRFHYKDAADKSV